MLVRCRLERPARLSPCPFLQQASASLGRLPARRSRARHCSRNLPGAPNWPADSGKRFRRPDRAGRSAPRPCLRIPRRETDDSAVRRGCRGSERRRALRRVRRGWAASNARSGRRSHRTCVHTACGSGFRSRAPRCAATTMCRVLVWRRPSARSVRPRSLPPALRQQRGSVRSAGRLKIQDVAGFAGDRRDCATCAGWWRRGWRRDARHRYHSRPG